MSGHNKVAEGDRIKSEDINDRIKAAGGDDCATDAFFRTVEIRYV